MKVKEAYLFTEEEIEKVENITDYFRYHNKNLNATQYDFVCNVLPEIVKHMKDSYAGKTVKDTSYLENI